MVFFSTATTVIQFVLKEKRNLKITSSTVFKNVEEVLINSTYIVTFYTSERQTPKNS